MTPAEILLLCKNRARHHLRATCRAERHLGRCGLPIPWRCFGLFIRQAGHLQHQPPGLQELEARVESWQDAGWLQQCCASLSEQLRAAQAENNELQVGWQLSLRESHLRPYFAQAMPLKTAQCPRKCHLFRIKPRCPSIQTSRIVTTTLGHTT